MRIACWSGPRNISTALMRSWSSRSDVFVSDEPFYAYYLKERQLKHPMYKEIIKHYPNTYDEVVRNLISEIPNNKEHWYQKHMAHHIVDFNNLEWITRFNNCFLIRNPKDVLLSYIKKNTLNSAEDLGYIQQYKIMRYLKKKGIKYTIIDTDLFLKDPEYFLNQWCDDLKITFDKRMLKWKKGVYSTDGIWSRHWYDNVIKTDSFKEMTSMNCSVPKEYYKIYNTCEKYYIKLKEYKGA
jgi:hypothetical protein